MLLVETDTDKDTDMFITKDNKEPTYTLYHLCLYHSRQSEHILTYVYANVKSEQNVMDIAHSHQMHRMII